MSGECDHFSLRAAADSPKSDVIEGQIEDLEVRVQFLPTAMATDIKNVDAVWLKAEKLRIEKERVEKKKEIAARKKQYQ